MFWIGLMSGAFLMLVVVVLSANYLPPRKPNPHNEAFDNRLVDYWERVERRMDEQVLVWNRIADAVTTWEQRYTRRVKKATKAEE